MAEYGSSGISDILVKRGLACKYDLPGESLPLYSQAKPPIVPALAAKSQPPQNQTDVCASRSIALLTWYHDSTGSDARCRLTFVATCERPYLEHFAKGTPMQLSFSERDGVTTVAITGRITFSTLEPGHDPLAAQVPGIYSRPRSPRSVRHRIHRQHGRELVVDGPQAMPRRRRQARAALDQSPGEASAWRAEARPRAAPGRRTPKKHTPNSTR